MNTRILFCIALFAAAINMRLDAQPPGYKINNTPFESVFSDIPEGCFDGTANGVIILGVPGGKEVLLDFQGSSLVPEITKDPEEVYDVSYKNYVAHTTSGRTKITYSTYGLANHLSVEYGGKTYSAGAFDGAYDCVIDGLDFKYTAEKNAEYLILTASKDIALGRSSGIYIEAGSAIIFAVKR